MQRIFVPFDFSIASDWGFHYATKLAEQNGARIIVGHIYRPPYIDNAMPPATVQDILTQKEEKLLLHLKNSAKSANKNISIEYKLSSGAATNIEELAQEEGADLIVMGTSGNDSSGDSFWGTNASNVVEEAKCPVLVVPIHRTHTRIKHIAYATELNPEDVEHLKRLAPIADVLNAQIHCIHINLLIEDDFETLKEQEFRDALMQDLPSVQFHTRSSTSVQERIESFMRIYDIDILTMVTHKRGFWSKLFGNKSITKKMVAHSQTPLLAFHES